MTKLIRVNTEEFERSMHPPTIRAIVRVEATEDPSPVNHRAAKKATRKKT